MINRMASTPSADEEEDVPRRKMPPSIEAKDYETQDTATQPSREQA